MLFKKLTGIAAILVVYGYFPFEAFYSSLVLTLSIHFFPLLCNSYVRLELLEGVVAYHNGHVEKARGSLNSAHAKYLQVHSKKIFYFLLIAYYSSEPSIFSCSTNQSHP